MNRKNKPDGEYIIALIIAYAMIVFCVVVLIVIGFLLASCSTPPPKIVERVVTDVRTETTFITDTLFVPLPAQSEKIITRDSISTLETDYATSTAKILSDGSLFHDLWNKEKEMEIPFLKPMERKDSIVYREVPVPTPVPYEVRVPTPVPQPLTWWQQTQLRGFWALLIVLVLVKRKGFFSILMWFVRKFLPIGK